MHTSVSIIDYTNNIKIFLVFIEEDFNPIMDMWNKRNSFSQELRDITNIHHNKMSSMTLSDWKLTIIKILDMALVLPISEHTNIENMIIKNLHDVLVGFSYKYHLETENNLDYLRISGIEKSQYSFMIASSDLTLSIGA